MKEDKGIGGQPLWFKLGTKMPVSNGSSVAMSLACGE